MSSCVRSRRRKLSLRDERAADMFHVKRNCKISPCAPPQMRSPISKIIRVSPGVYDKRRDRVSPGDVYNLLVFNTPK